MRPCSSRVSLFKLQALSSDHRELHSRLVYRAWQRKLWPTNLSIVRTLAFEPLGHLSISISEMAN